MENGQKKAKNEEVSSTQAPPGQHEKDQCAFREFPKEARKRVRNMRNVMNISEEIIAQPYQNLMNGKS